MGQLLSCVLQRTELWMYHLPIVLASAYPLLLFFPVAACLTLLVSWWTYRLYCRDLAVVLRYYRTPRAGQRAMDDKPFRIFLVQSRDRWYYNMLSSMCIVLAVIVNLNLEAAQADIQKHLILQVLAVLSMAQALCSLFLNMLYKDVADSVLATYGHTLVWVEGAIAANSSGWLRTAVLMTMPTALTAGAVINFAAYRLASGVIWIANPEDVALAQDDGAHQAVAIASVSYMVFVIVQTVYAVKVFQGIKDYAGPIPQIAS